jgi:hypothetical protein
MTKNMPILYIVALVVLLCLSPRVHAQEDGIFMSFEKELPDVAVISKKQLVEQMQYIEELSPEDDPYAGFHMFIPKGWERAPSELIKNAQVNNSLIGGISAYYSDPHDLMRSAVYVETYELKRNISAKNWLIMHLLDYGYLFEGIKAFDREKAEALAVIYDDESIDYKERIVARINGNRVILMRFSTPLNRWEQEKHIQATTAKTFRILREDDTTIYHFLSYNLGGYIKFQYPDSWTIGVQQIDNYDRTSINLFKYEAAYDEGRMAHDARLSSGIINVKVVQYRNIQTDVANEIRLVKETLENKGYKFGDLINYDILLDYPDDTNFQNFEIYEAASENQKSANFEIWIASMKTDEYFYLVSMITAKRDQQFFRWIENKSAFEEIISSLRPTLTSDYITY